MSRVLDIYSDKSLKGIVSILRDHPDQYDLVKEAEVNYEDRLRRPVTSFAWPEERAYPIFNEKMARLSSLYRTQLPPEVEVPEYVDSNLEKAAFLYDFELPKIVEKKEVKVASIQEDDYLIPSLKKFPIRNKEEAALVQGVLVKNAHVMGYNHLTEAAHRFISKMAEFGANSDEVHPIMYKFAGLTLCNKDLLEASILRRLDFAKENYHKHYRKLASIMGEMDFNRPNLVKVAHTLERIDKEADMVRLYDKHIMNPMESVFNTTKIRQATKEASLELFTPEMAEKVSEEQVATLLGDDILSEAKIGEAMDRGKLAEVINSLPTDMVTDFVERIA